jgi:hypothetical protein
MNGSPNGPMNGRGSVSEAVASALRQTSFLRVIVVLAATVVVLVGIRLGAPILNPIFFALDLSLLFSPIYSWLKRRDLSSSVVLVIMLRQASRKRELRALSMRPPRMSNRRRRCGWETEWKAAGAILQGYGRGCLSRW